MTWTKDKPSQYGYYWITWAGWCPRVYRVEVSWSGAFIVLDKKDWIHVDKIPASTCYFGPLVAPKVPDGMDKE